MRRSPKVQALIEKARADGFEFDSLAADRVVSIVELYLADYRDILQGDRETKDALLWVLNLFLDAGWPNAQMLLSRLDEVFRG
jgi:hypothetical protein